MLGLLATVALLRSRAGRTLLRCSAIMAILFVYKYLIFVKIIIAFLVILEVAARMVPAFTPTQPESSSAFLPPETNNDETVCTGPYRAPWREQEDLKQEEQMHEHLKHFAMQPARGPPTILRAAANTSNDSNRLGPSRSNRRQREEIDRHLQRLGIAAAAADAVAATQNMVTSHYGSERVNGGYPDRIGGTLGAATFTGSNPEIGDFWTRREFPVPAAPIGAPQATSNDLRYGSPGLEHSKSLPESTNMYNHGSSIVLGRIKQSFDTRGHRANVLLQPNSPLEREPLHSCTGDDSLSYISRMAMTKTTICDDQGHVLDDVFQKF